MAYPLRRNYEKNFSSDFVFRRPPEAPVFEPTYEEFRNPLAYISKIRGVAEKAGICKIKPPPDWQPPFALDIDTFTFVPRVQKLNEMEANTRIKLNFLDELAKYWQLQGTVFKIPTIEGKIVDLYDLNKIVCKFGGLKKVDKDRKWLEISNLMGFGGRKGIPYELRTHYASLLNPYDVFCKIWKNVKKEPKKEEVKINNHNIKKQEEVKAAEYPVETITIDDDDDDDDHSPKRLRIVEDDEKDNIELKIEDKKFTQQLSRQLLSSQKYVRRGGNCFIAANTISKDLNDAELVPANKELARLAFYGAGPKLPGYDPESKSYQSKTRGKVTTYDFGDVDKSLCKVCKLGVKEKDRDDKLLYCNNCEDGYHFKCLNPPLEWLPEGDWSCPKCVSIEILKLHNFGFEQSGITYTLQQFGAMADNFKENYFQKPVYEVPTEVVEQEFWRIVGCIDEAVTVQYGADLHTLEHGSGFPTCIENDDSMISEKEYADSPWNLTNLPVCEGSVLQYIESDISGMKVPWVYVGMCFGTFCWHNEDHWNYSINYLHWGEPKTWYGVPGSQANLLEDTMKSLAPELFENQPDLLQQLVTLMNPNQLMDKNIQVVRTDQQAGEFVITFPRAYHAGFNQGYNFAEAVNFAPAQWIPLGRECVEHYGNLCRSCVFSHDELMMRVALCGKRLSDEMAKATYEDLVKMTKLEVSYRKQAESWGVVNIEQYTFENFPDDDRTCAVCKTTLYLSGITCECQLSKVQPQHTCIKHHTQLCSCSPEKHIFRYRFSMPELLEIVRNMRAMYKF